MPERRPLTVLDLALFVKENTQHLPLDTQVVISTDPEGNRFVPLSAASLYAGSYLADPNRPYLGGEIFNLPGARTGDFDPAPEEAQAALLAWPLY